MATKAGDAVSARKGRSTRTTSSKSNTSVETKPPKRASNAGKKEDRAFPPQSQDRQPGIQSEMKPRPQIEDPNYRAGGKLEGKRAIVTGGDSGIGQAAAILFAKEGADVAIIYLDEHEDAKRAKERIEELGRTCELIAGDVGDSAFCRDAVKRSIRALGGLDILVNNAAEQHSAEDLAGISDEQFERTFRTNIFAYFYMAKAALESLGAGGAIINTTSVTAYRGSPHLIDYASTKGAIVSFTRSLAESLASKGIRVNGVAPGPIWTPLIPASFKAEEVTEFGKDVPMKRAGQPCEVAPAYVFLASSDSSYMTGQVLHPNGGEVIGG